MQQEMKSERDELAHDSSMDEERRGAEKWRTLEEAACAADVERETASHG